MEGNKARVYDLNRQSSPIDIIDDAENWAETVDLNHDDSRLAVSGYDKKVRVYNLTTSPASLLYTLTDAGDKIHGKRQNNPRPTQLSLSKEL